MEEDIKAAISLFNKWVINDYQLFIYMNSLIPKVIKEKSRLCNCPQCWIQLPHEPYWEGIKKIDLIITKKTV